MSGSMEPKEWAQEINSRLEKLEAQVNVLERAQNIILEHLGVPDNIKEKRENLFDD